MSVIYLRNDFRFDYGQYQTQAKRQSGNINDYIKHFTRFLKEKEERLNAEIGGREVTSTTTIPVEMDEAMNDLVYWAQLNTKETVHNALFVMINSYLEWSLVELCRLSGIYIGDNFYKYNNEQGIHKAKNYLKEKLKIPITTFMIATDPYLQRFVQEFTETNNGKAYFASLDRLGAFIFRDFESGKRKTVY